MGRCRKAENQQDTTQNVDIGSATVRHGRNAARSVPATWGSRITRAKGAKEGGQEDKDLVRSWSGEFFEGADFAFCSELWNR